MQEWEAVGVLVRHEYGSEGAAYVRSQLLMNQGYKRLGSLLAHHDIEHGRTWALVPAGSSAAQRTSFDGSWSGFDFDWETEAAQWLAEAARAQTDGRGLLCFEHWGADKEDPFLQTGEDVGDVFFCGKDVYEAVTQSAPVEAFGDLATESLWYPTIGMITRLPGGTDQIPSRGEVTVGQLTVMAETAAVIIVSAWDAEGLVFWQPSA